MIPSIANINSINTTRSNNYEPYMYGKNNNNNNTNGNNNNVNSPQNQINYNKNKPQSPIYTSSSPHNIQQKQ